MGWLSSHRVERGRWVGLHKPDSVPPIFRPTVWPFVCAALCRACPHLRGMRLLPGAIHPLAGTCGQAGRFSCSVLHRVGFVMPPSLRLERWALTPPFHPYLLLPVGGLFSVTLSIALGCPRASDACARHAAFWCPDFPLIRILPRQDRRATTPADPKPIYAADPCWQGALLILWQSARQPLWVGV